MFYLIYVTPNMLFKNDEVTIVKTSLSSKDTSSDNCNNFNIRTICTASSTIPDLILFRIIIRNHFRTNVFEECSCSPRPGDYSYIT